MKSKSILRSVILYLYFIPMIIAASYYNWTYARENGFGKWLAFGELTATGKAIIWPYYFFSSKEKDKSFEHFSQSIEYANQTSQITNADHPFVSLTPEERKKFVGYKKQALDEGLLINIPTLNSKYPQFGDYFRDYYLKGIQLLVSANDKHNEQEFGQAFALLDTWADWYSANIGNIKSANQKEVK